MNTRCIENNLLSLSVSLLLQWSDYTTGGKTMIGFTKGD